MSRLGIALGAFELSAPIGQGAMASVFRGRHAGTGLALAIKVMSGQHVRRTEFVNAFRNEVEAVARLHHPGIVRVYDYGEVSGDAAARSDGTLEAGTPYLVMDLASEGSLDSVEPPADWPATKRLLLELLDALAHAHARGVVHRDLKPGNVLVHQSGDRRIYKLTDFGLSHAAPQQGPRSLPAETTRELMASSGTPPFMAPEQFAGDWRAQGPWTDLYALGCMAYLMVCGEVPFPHDDIQALAQAHATAPPPLLIPVMPVPMGLQPWVHTLMSKSLATRFLHAADAAHSLRTLDESLMTPAVAERQPPSEILSETGPTRLLTAPLAEPSEPAGFNPPSSTLLDRYPPPLPPHWRHDEPSPAPLAAGLGLFGLRTIPLVDRDHERDLLWSALRTVHEGGDPRAVVLRGSGGTGKSRLAAWIAQRAEEVGGAIVLRASHSALGGSQDGIVAMILRHLRCELLERQAFDERLRDVLATVGVDDPFLRHALLEVLSTRDEETTQLFDGMAAKPEERHRVLLRLLRLLATDRPLILLLDDAQWGLDALRFARRILYELVDPLPALVLLTVRDEALVSCLLERAELDYLLNDGFASAIELGRLPGADHHRLVEQMLGLSSSVVDRVAERTDGNPLFATQLVADWVSRGILIAGEDGLELSPGADDSLPDDIHTLCAVRIHEAMRRRTQDDRIALELAAMLGAEVREVEWRAVCRQRQLSPSAKLLADLGRIGILEAASLGTWRFAHGVIRESLERVARTNRRWESHNLVIATVLRQIEGVHSAELTARVGRHLAYAGEQHEAVSLLLDAARGFRLEGDFERTAAVLAERSALLDTMQIPTPHPHRHEAELLLALVDIDQGRLDQAAETARSVMESAAQHGWPRIEARAALRLADVASGHGAYDEALPLRERALITMRAIGDKRGEFEARQGVAEVHYYCGDRESAARAYLDNLAFAKKLQDELAVAETHWGLGYVRMWQGQHDVARASFESMREILERYGAAYRLADSLNALGELERLQGNYDAAERCYREGIRLDEIFGTAGGLVKKINLALVLMETGEHEQIADMLPMLLVKAEKRGDNRVLCAVYPLMMLVRAARRDWNGYDHAFKRTQELLEATGLRDGDVALSLEHAADMARQQGEPQRGAEPIRVAREHFAAMGRAERLAELDAKWGEHLGGQAGS